EQARIREAIMEAEKETSGEIRVHIESGVRGKVLDRAAWIFRKIGMHATEQRNGVLFYLALKNREFAIIGDKGINSKVPDDFWDKTKDILQEHFRTGKFTDGLVEGILLAGKQLKQQFPYQKGDVNELPDEISFDNPE
ncbi:MAG: TPM domain-containing protein, partial [Bacteroidales bacterium]